MFELSEQIKTGAGWVMVFPRGKHYVNKYQTVLNFDDKFYNNVVKTWTQSKFKPPYLDKDHDMRESYGNFTDYRVTPKGMEMYLQLNDAGKDLLKSGQYQFLSPTFGKSKDADGVEYETVVFTVSLVNAPALMVLESLQKQIALSMAEGNNSKGGPLVGLKETVAIKLGLNPEADDSSILNAIDTLLNGDKDISSVKLSLKAESEKVIQLSADLEKATQKQKEAEDALKVVKLTSLKDEAEKVIDEAIALQQYHPSLKEMKVKAYMANKEDIIAELKLIPAKKEGDKKYSTSSSGDKYELSAQDRKIAEDAGYDLSKPEDMKLFMSTLGGK